MCTFFICWKCVSVLRKYLHVLSTENVYCVHTFSYRLNMCIALIHFLIGWKYVLCTPIFLSAENVHCIHTYSYLLKMCIVITNFLICWKCALRSYIFFSAEIFSTCVSDFKKHKFDNWNWKWSLHVPDVNSCVLADSCLLQKK